MSNLILDRGSFGDFTSVSNIFIDEYMPKANGEFTKIYLHLLRLINNGRSELSIDKIADDFNMLEADVIRALNYWSDQNLISLSLNKEGNISGVRLESINSSRYFVKGIVQVNSDESHDILAMASGESGSTPAPESVGIVVPSKRKYTAKEISSFASDDRVKQLTFLAQTYLGKTLGSTDINSILYMLDGLGLETDFIEYIMESCISSGRRSLSCIEKQAIEYAGKGITTIEDAKADSKLRKAIFKSIYKIFGLTPKAPVKKEISYISKWTSEYGFTDEIILEACNRTMEHTHTASFQYTDSILTNWFNGNAKSMKAIEQLDAEHNETAAKAFKPKATRSKKIKSFEQRTYDYNELEKQLLANRDRKLKEAKSRGI